MRHITLKDNGYLIDRDLARMVLRFNKVSEKLFPEWDVEHFFYGSKLVMTTLRDTVSHNYGHFNISANRVSFNGHLLANGVGKQMELLTYNDELFNGKLVELAGF